MPRPGPRRELVALRMLPADVERIDERAAGENLRDVQGRPNRSEMIRVMVAYAEQHMPEGWRPS